MKVIFVTQNKLMHYRIPIFSIVNAQENIELTLAHCEKRVNLPDMQEIILERKKIGPFYWFKNLKKTCKGYDVIICHTYLENFSIQRMLLTWGKKHKIILFGPGVRCSTAPGHNYDSPSKLEGLKEFFYKKADALVFYSSYPIEKHAKYGVPREKMFVANNTVKIIKNDYSPTQVRDQFLFVGTLYKTKGLDKLLSAYAEACKQCPDIYKLTIVGDGDIPYYKQMASDLQIEGKVEFTGGIYDAEPLSEHFMKSVLCLSPNQAGLTVLISFGYGVPFVTSTDALTGGERLNVIEGQTGFYCDTQESITQIMIDSYKNPEKYREIGKNAHDYYWNSRTPEIMAQGFVDAINYVTNK
ncbi:MAG: glycosyltransferase [Bacteroidales bacterium]|nr:glycosyltransferase [Bacteroidales bacterium]MBO7494895.1 glycosyltransferase [Bacteroidales bacterium]